MSSSIQTPPIPLKNKLSQVRYLLDDADKRLQEESKIFTTNSSASTNPNNIQPDGTIHTTGIGSNDLIRTITDVRTLKSVLSCPIFNRIVNVTDSLDILSYQINYHPSISPTDINIGADGELILAPPIESTSYNNIINSQLDESSHQSRESQQIGGLNLIPNNHNLKGNDRYQNQNPSSAIVDQVDFPDGFAQNHLTSNLNNQKHDQLEQINGVQQHNYSTPNGQNGTEKLVHIGCSQNFTNSSSNDHHQQVQRENRMPANDSEENYRLYKSTGNCSLDQVGLNNGQPPIQTELSLDHPVETKYQNGFNGYSNEMYNIAQDINLPEVISASNRQDHNIQPQSNIQMNGQNLTSSQPKNLLTQNMLSGTTTTINHSTSLGPKAQSAQNAGIQYNRGSCSPSSSAGSTIRCADDGDSGASSYQSHVIKNSQTPSFAPCANQKLSIQNSTVVNSSKECRQESEQSLINELTPDMERIVVTLEKDNNGLGITIAGYTCEEEEISGIFIKSITPLSPADRSGKIRTLDQIFAVDGKELLGYSNKEAVNVLKHTGKMVTLELMRYLAESKYQKLQTVLANALPTANSKMSSSVETKKAGYKDSSSPTRSNIPISTMRENNLSPTRPSLVAPGSSNRTCVQVSNTSQSNYSRETESIYKNDSVTKHNGFEDHDTMNSKYSTIDHIASKIQQNPQYYDQKSNQIPVAAQRGSNKVINIKQGARNTIDIKSPVCHASSTATYINSNDTGIELPEKKKLLKDVSNDFDKPEWEKDAQIIELHKDTSQSLGFHVKEYNNPKDPQQSIIMITSLNPGGLAEQDGRLSVGDLLIFVDDTNLEGASMTDTAKALKKANGQVRLGVLKLKR